MTDRRPAIDPAVAALLSNGERRQQQARQPLKAKQQAAKAAAKQAARNRVMLDLPPEIIDRIGALAHDLEIPVSQAAAGLILLGWADRRRLADYLLPSKSPRFTNTLALGEIDKPSH